MLLNTFHLHFAFGREANTYSNTPPETCYSYGDFFTRMQKFVSKLFRAMRISRRPYVSCLQETTFSFLQMWQALPVPDDARIRLFKKRKILCVPAKSSNRKLAGCSMFRVQLLGSFGCCWRPLEFNC
jgi:hypothetical protein